MLCSPQHQVLIGGASPDMAAGGLECRGGKGGAGDRECWRAALLPAMTPLPSEEKQPSQDAATL